MEAGSNVTYWLRSWPSVDSQKRGATASRPTAEVGSIDTRAAGESSRCDADQHGMGATIEQGSKVSSLLPPGRPPCTASPTDTRWR